MRQLIIACVRCYQYCLSPYMMAHCRFHPSCSGYAVEALQIHGLFKGLWLTLRRISSCHPWHAGGYDPVPEKRKDKKAHG